MLKRRALLKIFTLIPLFKWNNVFSNGKITNSVYVNSIEELRNTVPSQIGCIITLTSLSSNNGKGGGVFVAVGNDGNLIDDNGSIINTDSKMSWLRLDSIRKIKKPEWYGCQGDGVTDDSEPFNNMLKALKDGDCIVLSNNSNYFNNLPRKESRWIIKESNITIVGNNATLSRRGTSPKTMHLDGGNLATLKVTMAENFSIIGKLLITSNEIEMPLVDSKNNIISQNNYPRAYISSHALFFEKVKKVILPETLTCNNAVFPCYVLECEDINISGQFNNSGQVYPVIGADLQIGSGIKIAKTKGFILNITAENCAYCGCEIEPYSTNGEVNIISKNSYQHGCIIHRNGYNIKIKIVAENASGAGLKISAGSKEINGEVFVRNSTYGCIVISECDYICENLNIKMHTLNTQKTEIIAKNVNDNFPSIRNTTISISEEENSPSITNRQQGDSLIGEIDNAQNCNIILNAGDGNKKILLSNSSNCKMVFMDKDIHKQKLIEKNNIGTSITYNKTL